MSRENAHWQGFLLSSGSNLLLDTEVRGYNGPSSPTLGGSLELLVSNGMAELAPTGRQLAPGKALVERPL